MSMADSLFKKDTVFLLEDDKEYSAEEILQNIGKKIIKEGLCKRKFWKCIDRKRKEISHGIKDLSLCSGNSTYRFGTCQYSMH